MQIAINFNKVLREYIANKPSFNKIINLSNLILV
jgi:hypothetical protein